MTLGACSPAASPEPAPTTTASSPSPTPSPEPTLEETAEPSPEPSPSTTDPNDRSELLVEPEEMQDISEEAAIAAAKYFMGLLEYVFLTGDLRKWESMSHRDCVYCRSIANRVRALQEEHAVILTGAPEWAGAPEAEHLVGQDRWLVTLRAELAESAKVNADGNVIETYPASRLEVVADMHFSKGEWRTMRVQVSGNE